MRNEPDPKLTDPGAYSNADKFCDIIMKGGITSGVTYPWAVCEIARTYRLRGVGGSSAGAIAAAVAGAAEFGRQSGGYARLASLPERLSQEVPRTKRSFMFELFQPTANTRPLLDMIVSALDAKGPLLIKGARGLSSAGRSFRLYAALGGLPGLCLLGLSIAWIVTQDATQSTLGLVTAASAAVGGLILAFFGALIATVTKTTLHAFRAIPRNGFGVCSGQATPEGGGHQGLTDWLTEEIDAIAGVPGPLTMGDLDRAGIQLQLLTTNLTDGTPYTLPLKSLTQFYFDPARFRELFPERIVRWMEEHPPAGPKEETRRLRQEVQWRVMQPLRPFPDSSELPVVVAARMSLSFPFLISAVPLFALDWTRRASLEAGREWSAWTWKHSEDWDKLRDPAAWDAVAKPSIKPEGEICWFSDGGITSNFPVHLFERPIPMWPTFFINLNRVDDEVLSDDQSKNVWAASAHREGVVARHGISNVNRFGRSILDTMQNYLDNARVRMVGLRDRVVWIFHTKQEGGMNLNMSPAAILAFSERGRWAGRILAERFGQPPPEHATFSWDDNRWVRYRVAMANTEQLLRDLLSGFQQTDSEGELSLWDLIRQSPVTSETWRLSYPLSPTQRDFAEGATRELLELTQRWIDSGQSFLAGAPNPRSELRMFPRF